MLSPMRFEAFRLHLLDQRLLPFQEKWNTYADAESIALAIETMVVRGAPAIGCSAAYALVCNAHQHQHLSKWSQYKPHFSQTKQRLAATRPTAVNLFIALDYMEDLTKEFKETDSLPKIIDILATGAHKFFADDLEKCRKIGNYGAEAAPLGKLNILTHCNAGSLATAGYGTALGVIRSLHSQGRVKKVFVDETRPYLQGTRITAFELADEKIPFALITDSAAAYYMSLGEIDMVVVGADRIAANGDTANKIGTLSVAINANYFKVPFFIAAPITTFDKTISTGAQIKVEMRDPDEVKFALHHQITNPEYQALNPSFDVTPNALISGIITDFGTISPPFSVGISRLFASVNN